MAQLLPTGCLFSNPRRPPAQLSHPWPAGPHLFQVSFSGVKPVPPGSSFLPQGPSPTLINVSVPRSLASAHLLSLTSSPLAAPHSRVQQEQATPAPASFVGVCLGLHQWKAFSYGAQGSFLSSLVIGKFQFLLSLGWL